MSYFFSSGDPFGYVEGDHFVIIGPEENKAYLVDAQDEISSTNQNIEPTAKEDIITLVNAAYPSVRYLSYQIKTYSVGDKVNIGGEI